uniref:Uncharacterized protein n=1 Tax=Oryza rufipogon TaxID=4529 RepID=A0A0E0RB78_ORYRU
MPNLYDYLIELNTNVTPDQRRYNAPTAWQVAAIWLEGDDPIRTFDRHVLVHAKGDNPSYIKVYHGCYDPLVYPLFNPNRETGWNLKISYKNPNKNPCGVDMDETCEAPNFVNVHINEESTFDDLPENEVIDNYLDNEDGNDDSNRSGKGKKEKFITEREYYCFRLQVRRELLNIILFGGRFFQQWAVDICIKIESMRLDWYSNPVNQKRYELSYTK